MKNILHWGITAVVSVLFALAGVLPFDADNHTASAFAEKAELLRQCVLTDWTEKIGISPAGSAGHAVFISVCDKTERADVYTGTGNSLDAAWDAAAERAENALHKSGQAPVWVKVDVVVECSPISTSNLAKKVAGVREEFFRFGVAFDREFNTALLEEEMNGAKIYNYSGGGIDFKYLNNYLAKANRKTLDELPEEVTIFKCAGWFCDEDNLVYQLSSGGFDYGRRQIESVDADFAMELIINASEFLEAQVLDDGSFIYGLYPRFDNKIGNYNIVRHAGTIWALICRYRLVPSKELAEKIERTIGYMIGSMLYDDMGRAYLYEKKSNEIKLGGCGIAVVALTEYMNVFKNDKYKEVCIALGNGILTMLDKTNGTYYHVLREDFSRKEEFRTIYYDGEATFALCRLYGLTGNTVWLDAAESAVGHFIEADYTQYRDHWVAYSMNEITKYVTNRQDYYVFALENAQKNLKKIKERETTGPTNLELLMSTFELYDRIVESGQSLGDFEFDLKSLLDAIFARADYQLNGYFFPEYAMYMKNPQRILDTFMVRDDGYRVRIDDVQHNIGGYYLYCVNYDKLLQYGKPDVAVVVSGEEDDIGVKTIVVLSVVPAIVAITILAVVIRIKLKSKQSDSEHSVE